MTDRAAPEKESDAAVIGATRHWIERAVIGLNLCPFARGVYIKDRIRYTVSRARDAVGVLLDLDAELAFLPTADPQAVDTALLIMPDALDDFYAFNDVLHDAERLIKKRRLRGVLQLVGFHPRYQFADTEADDVVNATNRSPYPVLHLLRETSVTEAVLAYPDTEEIVLRNQRRLRELGDVGFKAWLAAESNRPEPE